MITNYFNKKISIFWIPPPKGASKKHPTTKTCRFYSTQFFGYPPPEGGAPYFQTTLCSVSIKTSNKSP